MDLSHPRPGGNEEGGAGAGPPEGLLWEQVCGAGGVGGQGPGALGLGLGLGLRDTLSFLLAPQIEPPSHHFSPEEVRIGVLRG